MYQDYFDLQLRFAARLAQLSGVSLPDAVARCTNLRRRFGLWGPTGELPWAAFLEQVQARPGHDALLSLALDLHEGGPMQAASPFGCFSYEPPDADGTLRLHFMPQAHHRQTRPLANESLPARRAELRALVRDVRRRHPGAREVRGLSWLYHVEAYRGLFPLPYVASVAPAAEPLHLNGSSVWGQVLDHQHRVRPGMAERVLGALTPGTVGAPWRAFPLQPLAAGCPTVHFFAAFDAAPAAS
ncbi:MAG: hypothetical protein EOO24_25805 [Comamonadaceae bacterium]|nr:MAG: hypothetical protein EOO24_25805 [Comamonadaceae bacterium]